MQKKCNDGEYFLNQDYIMELLYGKEDGQNMFLDHYKTYEVLKDIIYPFGDYLEMNRICDEYLDEERKCTTISPIEIALKLDVADIDKPVPMAIVLFLEKVYKDAYYQLGRLAYGYNLGNLYTFSRYNYLNYEKAFKYYYGARDYVIDASTQLGKSYLLGRGVEQNYKNAFLCLVKANIGGKNVEASYLLSDMYRNGYYVEQDIIQAVTICEQMYDESSTDVSMSEVALRYGLDCIFYLKKPHDEILRILQTAENLFYKKMKYEYREATDGLEMVRMAQDSIRNKLDDENRKFMQEGNEKSAKIVFE